MWLSTKLGLFSIAQSVPPDDGDPAEYHVCTHVRENLEKLLQATALQRDILTWPESENRFRITASQQEVFEILSALAETIDYTDFDSAIAAIPGRGTSSTSRSLAVPVPESL